MAHDIRQCFLERPEERERGLRRHGWRLGWRVERDREAGLLLEALRERAQRGHEAKVVEQWRTQRRRDAADAADAGVHQLQHARDGGRERWRRLLLDEAEL